MRQCESVWPEENRGKCFGTAALAGGGLRGADQGGFPERHTDSHWRACAHTGTPRSKHLGARATPAGARATHGGARAMLAGASADTLGCEGGTCWCEGDTLLVL